MHFPYCCSLAKSCPTLCDPMGCSTPGFPVLYCLPEFAQTHVHWVSDAIQPSHPLSLSSCLAPCQRQSLPVSRLFASGSQSTRALVSTSDLPMNIQDWFPIALTDLILMSEGLSRVSSSNPGSILRRSAFFTVQLSHLYLTAGKTSFDSTDLCWQSDVSAF